jgi:excisionase family DNA binding protein
MPTVFSSRLSSSPSPTPSPVAPTPTNRLPVVGITEPRSPARTVEPVDPPALRTRPPAFLSLRELAVVLGVSERGVRNWVRRGLLPRVKLGRRVLFRWTQIDEALAKLERRR